jgi:predicted enzyme related to lactoylglutathione lyase
MQRPRTNSVVHLELHTGDLETARGFYAALFGWRAESVESGAGPYVALGLGGLLGGLVGGGLVECGLEPALWLPYVEVPEIVGATRRAAERGAKVLLSPREGPAGWRSVVSSAAGGQVALWQAKR